MLRLIKEFERRANDPTCVIRKHYAYLLRTHFGYDPTQFGYLAQ